MKTYRNLYPKLCSYKNLELAFQKARKRKTLKAYVIGFEDNLQANLLKLQAELKTFTYLPAPIKTFTVRDPKTRRIGASDFRDRIVHHAPCNVIAPIFERTFIHDSFANQKGKGTHSAIRRLECFIGKVTQNRKPKARNHQNGGGAKRFPVPSFRVLSWFPGYALKADIRHYFDTVDHGILLGLLQRKIKDPHVLWLIRKILQNHKAKSAGKGMPLGNLTSQFFANVYLHELDLFVKHGLKAKHYLRYVDDFVLLHRDAAVLREWQHQIGSFLGNRLGLTLHPEKSRVVPVQSGLAFLGFRIFPKYRLLKKSNARRIWKRLERFRRKHDAGRMPREDVLKSLEGWIAYAKFANTYRLRKRVVAAFNRSFHFSLCKE